MRLSLNNSFDVNISTFSMSQFQLNSNGNITATIQIVFKASTFLLLRRKVKHDPVSRMSEDVGSMLINNVIAGMGCYWQIFWSCLMMSRQCWKSEGIFMMGRTISSSCLLVKQSICYSEHYSFFHRNFVCRHWALHHPASSTNISLPSYTCLVVICIKIRDVLEL